MRFSIDSDREHIALMGDHSGSVTGAVRQTAHHA
jgi:hypothetical protein